MLSVGLLPLALDSLVISALLIVLNRRGVGLLASGAATIVTTFILVLGPFVALGASGSFRQVLQFWLLFVLIPGAVVFALSRISSVARRPWLLLVLGPISFLVILIVVMIAINLGGGPRRIGHVLPAAGLRAGCLVSQLS